MSPSEPVIDTHVHLWDPRTTPRRISTPLKLFGWNRHLFRFVFSTAAPKGTRQFFGHSDHLTRPYLLKELERDWGASRTRLRGVVHVQAGWHPKIHRDVVDETRWLEALDPEARCIRAIVGAAHLEAPDLAEIIDAHKGASTRFCGIRDMTGYHPAPRILNLSRAPDLVRNPAWRSGYELLGKEGFCFDAWMFHGQIDEFAALAEATPETRVALCHMGTPIGILGEFGGVGATAGERVKIDEEWKTAIARFARVPHAVFKVSGIMPALGLGAERREMPMSKGELVDRIGPLVSYLIDTVGIERCMFGSNFPVDKVSFDLETLISAYDELLSNRTPEEKSLFFSGVAQEYYRLDKLGGHS